MVRRIRVLMLLALLAVGGASLMATPEREEFWEYYTSPTSGILCGEKWVLCTGVVRWGTPTPYYVMFYGNPC